MSTSKLFILIFISTIIIGNSPSFGQEWLLLGNGGTNPATDYLGTNDANPLNIKTTFATTPQPINFFTNNTLRMTLDAVGNFGIGLPPNFRLDVQDNPHSYSSEAFA